jgi:hypothetical protein
MGGTMGRSLLVASGFAFVFFLCISASAQAPPADTLKVDYFAYANSADLPDGTLHLTNPGTSGGSVCADIFVWDQNQEMSECCSCLLTTNDLRTLSVDTDLTSNPLTGEAITTGSISIISAMTSENQCPIRNKITPVSGGVRAWATHVDIIGLEGASPSPDATLSTAEQNRLQVSCYVIYLDGSGQGICTCGTGD